MGLLEALFARKHSRTKLEKREIQFPIKRHSTQKIIIFRVFPNFPRFSKLILLIRQPFKKREFKFLNDRHPTRQNELFRVFPIFRAFPRLFRSFPSKPRSIRRPDNREFVFSALNNPAHFFFAPIFRFFWNFPENFRFSLENSTPDFPPNFSENFKSTYVSMRRKHDF